MATPAQPARRPRPGRSSTRPPVPLLRPVTDEELATAPRLWTARWVERLKDENQDEKAGAGASSVPMPYDEAAAWLTAELERNIGRWAPNDVQRAEYLVALGDLRDSTAANPFYRSLRRHTLSIEGVS